MPALISTDYFGEITWLGLVPDRAASLRSHFVTELDLSFAGPKGEAHGGLTAPSCMRVTAQYPEGTEIRNVRQLTILSQEDILETAAEMGMSRIDPAWLGANIILKGLPDFTHIPPSSRLQGGESGATLTVDMENRPCHLPAREIEAEAKGFGARYKAAAKGRRGVTAWVAREGVLRVGESIRLHIPDQRAWAP